jgi:two-component system LytT family sensor kinase
MHGWHEDKGYPECSFTLIIEVDRRWSRARPQVENMVEQQFLVALLVKIAVAASVASFMMRFRRIREIILQDERNIAQRLQLALIFSVIFGAGESTRIITHGQYQALDLALESAFIAGLLAGYVSGLVAGICVSLPAMLLAGEYMSMPLFSAAGVLGGLMRDLAPGREEIWHYSAFVDLNLYRVFRELIQQKGKVLERGVIEQSVFNLICNFVIVLVEFSRVAISNLFPGTAAFSIGRHRPGSALAHFVALSVTSLFTVSLPIRIWASVRIEQKLETQQRRLVEARLTALTNQINPHFLFNTLSSVATLIRINPDKARSMIYRLSSILRRLLRKTDNFSPLRDEIRFIDDYLAIEMVRFGDKLQFEKQVSSEVLDWLVPSMILQPIIENSVKHGLASKTEGGTIRLRAWPEGSMLQILVEDDGVGIEESKLMTLLNQGIGVSNVNERLRVLFETNYRLSVDSSPGKGTRTLIQLPATGTQQQVLLTGMAPG